MGGTLTALIGSYAPIAGAFESIASATGDNSSGIITFSSIPATYQHLQVRATTRGNGVNSFETYSARISTGSFVNEYATHFLRGNGSTVTAGSSTSTSAINTIYTPDNGTLSNTMGAMIMDIQDYANTTRNKTVRMIIGFEDRGGSGVAMMELRSGVRINTATVDSIEFRLSSGAWTTSTQFALYGIKGA